jgi:hypothetical protein
LLDLVQQRDSEGGVLRYQQIILINAIAVSVRWVSTVKVCVFSLSFRSTYAVVTYFSVQSL